MRVIVASPVRPAAQPQVPVDEALGGRADRGHDGRVSRNLGSSALSGTSGSGVAPAVRATRTGWRDPRLWVGILIVAASIVAGSRLLAAADDSVSVWAVAGDMGAGDTVTAEDLVARQVRFTEAADLDRYFAADEVLPADVQLLRGVGAGELLPRAAVGAAGDDGLLQVPIAVDARQVPPSVAAGSVVDVYLVPTAGGQCHSACDGTPVLQDVTVVDASSVDEGFGATDERQLVLGVRDDDAGAFFQALGASDGATVTIVRRG
jgi:hypothetical protein